MGDALPQTDPFDAEWLATRPASPTPDQRAVASSKHIPTRGPRPNPSQRRRSVAEAVESALRARPDEPLSLPALYEAVFDIVDFVPAENDVRLAGRALVKGEENFFKVGKSAFVWAPDGTPPPPPPPPRVVAMIELRRSGQTLDEVGKQFGITRERVRQLMRKHGGPDSASVRAAQIERMQSEGQAHVMSVSAAIRDVLTDMSPRSVEEVAAQTGIDSADVAKCWPDDLGHLRLWGASAPENRWSDQEILDALRAAAVYEYPLTANAYTALLAVGQITGPSVPRIGQRYGSWTAACEAAGVEPGRAVRSHYQSKWSDQDIADIVRQYLLDPKAPNSAHRFDEWRRVHVPDGPSFQTVRNRFGSWTEAKRRALKPTGSEDE
jgi:hypothetical protein